MTHIFFALLVLLSSPSHAVVKEVPQTSQRKVKVTLYKDLAFIEETRETLLKVGRNKLLIPEVPDSIIMETFFVHFRGLQSPLHVSEYTFQSPHLTRQELLKHSIGEPVYVLHHGAPPTSAKLLALDGDEAIVKSAELIWSVKQGQIGFPSLPHTLVPEPLIKLKVDAKEEGKCLFEMGYLAQGFSWNASYTVIVDAAEEKIDLTNWINIHNKSGMNIKKGLFRIAFAYPDGERFYDVRHPLTVADQGVKNISWLTAENLTPVRSFRVYPINDILKDEEGIVMKPPVETWLSVKNDTANGLGVPLPHGSMRVFRRNKDGALMYVGENKTFSVPIDGALSLRVGTTKDITVDMRQTDYRKLGNQVVESGYRVDLKNMTPHKKQVTIFQNVAGDWTILRETHPHAEEDNRVKWVVSLTPNETVSLRYRIRMNVREG